MRTIKVNKIRVCDSNINEVLNEANNLITNKETGYMVFMEANLLSNTLKNEHLRDVIANATMVCPDGLSVSLAAAATANRKVKRITGPMFMLSACDYGRAKKWRHFFYGGQPEVAEKLAQKLSELYPNLEIAGVYCPPFRNVKSDEPYIEISEDELKAEAEMLNNSNADLIWVGLGALKQEYWINTFRQHLNAPLLLGVGAAFDFHSGTRPWAPKWVRVIGLEWLYRMFFEGKGIFLRNLKCVFSATIFLIKTFLNKR